MSQSKHFLILPLLIPFFLVIVIVSPLEQTITNPRQVRDSDEAKFNPKNETEVRLLKFVVRFIVDNDEYLQDYGQECDPDLHKLWVKDNQNTSTPDKSLITADPETSFCQSDEWMGKICNFFKYLDCEPNEQGNGTTTTMTPNALGGTCVCDKNGTYGLNFFHDPNEDGIDKDLTPEKRSIKQKRRCRVEKDELCGFVRIPAFSFPGVYIEIPDFFECDPKRECLATNREVDGFVSEICEKFDETEDDAKTSSE